MRQQSPAWHHAHLRQAQCLSHSSIGLLRAQGAGSGALFTLASHAVHTDWWQAAGQVDTSGGSGQLPRRSLCAGSGPGPDSPGAQNFLYIPQQLKGLLSPHRKNK